MNLLNCMCGERWRDYAPFILRVVVGAVFVVHGYQKFFEIGVTQFSGFLGSLGIPLPLFFAYVVASVEFFGGLALVSGFLAHWAAKLLTIDMIVALLLVHLPNGFYVAKGGYEFVLVLFAASASLVLSGPGLWSLDPKWVRRQGESTH